MPTIAEIEDALLTASADDVAAIIEEEKTADRKGAWKALALHLASAPAASDADVAGLEEKAASLEEQLDVAAEKLSAAQSKITTLTAALKSGPVLEHVGQLQAGKDALVVIGAASQIDRQWTHPSRSTSRIGVDFSGPNAELLAHRLHPNGFEQLPDGTWRVYANNIVQGNVIKSAGQRYIAQEQLPDKVVSYPLGATSVKAMDATRGSGCGMIDGSLAALAASAVQVSVVRDASGAIVQVVLGVS